MYIYLMRHGAALDAQENIQRPLSPEGAQAVSQVAQLLKTTAPHFSEIRHSSKLRAKQTAHIMGQDPNFTGKVLACRGLEPMDPIDFILDSITAEPNVLWVGHLPYLSRFLSALVVGNEDKEIVEFQPATWVRLKMLSHGNWVVDHVLNPELLL